MFLLVAINTKYIHSNPSVYSLKAYANKVHNTGDYSKVDLGIVKYLFEAGKKYAMENH